MVIFRTDAGRPITLRELPRWIADRLRCVLYGHNDRWLLGHTWVCLRCGSKHGRNLW